MASVDLHLYLARRPRARPSLSCKAEDDARWPRGATRVLGQARTSALPTRLGPLCRSSGASLSHSVSPHHLLSANCLPPHSSACLSACLPVCLSSAHHASPPHQQDCRENAQTRSQAHDQNIFRAAHVLLSSDEEGDCEGPEVDEAAAISRRPLRRQTASYRSLLTMIYMKAGLIQTSFIWSETDTCSHSASLKLSCSRW